MARKPKNTKVTYKLATLWKCISSLCTSAKMEFFIVYWHHWCVHLLLTDSEEHGAKEMGKSTSSLPGRVDNLLGCCYCCCGGAGVEGLEQESGSATLTVTGQRTLHSDRSRGKKSKGANILLWLYGVELHLRPTISVVHLLEVYKTMVQSSLCSVDTFEPTYQPVTHLVTHANVLPAGLRAVEQHFN